MRAIRKTIIEINDGPQKVELTGPIRHLEPRTRTAISMRSEETGRDPIVRVFEAYADGQEIPADAVYIGTVVMPASLAMHLYEHLASAS